jgi:hypothetical protein
VSAVALSTRAPSILQDKALDEPGEVRLFAHQTGRQSC